MSIETRTTPGFELKRPYCRAAGAAAQRMAGAIWACAPGRGACLLCLHYLQVTYKLTVRALPAARRPRSTCRYLSSGCFTCRREHTFVFLKIVRGRRLVPFHCVLPLSHECSRTVPPERLMPALTMPRSMGRSRSRRRPSVQWQWAWFDTYHSPERPRRRWVRSPCDEKAKKGLHSTQLFPLFKAPALILNSGGRFRDIPPDRIAKIVQNI